jgi:hypothetical protein
VTPAAIKAAATAAVLALPRAWFPDGNRPETAGERDERIAAFVSDVVDEADQHAKRAGLSVLDHTALGLAFAYNESALAWEAHAGKPWPGRPSPFGPAGERCLFQMHRSAYMVPIDYWRPFERDDWIGLVGLSPAATRRCAHAGMITIGWHANLCRGYLRTLTADDRVWFGATIAAQYHRPSLPCGQLSVGSMRRGRLYAALRYQITKRNAAAGQ